MPKNNDAWFAWTLVLTAVLLLSNAAWFYNWRVRALEHAEALAAVKSKPERGERVVYEYRGSTAARRVQPQPQRQRRTPAVREIVAGEECFNGVIIRRTSAGMESTGERCL